MGFLFFFVLIIQFLTYWIFEPFITFLEYVFEVRFLPILALLAFILLFSTKKIFNFIKKKECRLTDLN